VVATELSWSGFRQWQERLSGWSVQVRRGHGLQPILNEPVEVVVVAGLGYAVFREKKGYPRFLSYSPCKAHGFSGRHLVSRDGALSMPN
jgi:hypothetical protein